MAPAPNAYTADFPTPIVHEDNWQCTFLPALPSSESLDDAVGSNCNIDTCKDDQYAQHKFTDTPKPS